MCTIWWWVNLAGRLGYHRMSTRKRPFTWYLSTRIRTTSGTNTWLSAWECRMGVFRLQCQPGQVRKHFLWNISHRSTEWWWPKFITAKAHQEWIWMPCFMFSRTKKISSQLAGRIFLDLWIKKVSTVATTQTRFLRPWIKRNGSKERNKSDGLLRLSVCRNLRGSAAVLATSFTTTIVHCSWTSNFGGKTPGTSNSKVMHTHKRTVRRPSRSTRLI